MSRREYSDDKWVASFLKNVDEGRQIGINTEDGEYAEGVVTSVQDTEVGGKTLVVFNAERTWNVHIEWEMVEGRNGFEKEEWDVWAINPTTGEKTVTKAWDWDAEPEQPEKTIDELGDELDRSEVKEHIDMLRRGRGQIDRIIIAYEAFEDGDMDLATVNEWIDRIAAENGGSLALDLV